MPIAMDTSKWPACTHQECGADTFGPYHGVNCARARFAAEQLENWQKDMDRCIFCGKQPNDPPRPCRVVRDGQVVDESHGHDYATTGA